MTSYYNENDPFAAKWLRKLIAEGLIPAGDVDERSIKDVNVVDTIGYDQCHFFAGIGGWPVALALAGWPDDRPVWTGSCPCQPFSAAGKRGGVNDDRHLWPWFRELVRFGNPPNIFGEQVASKDGRTWLSGVRTDLEDLGYAVGAADLCAAGAGEEGEGRFVYPGGEESIETIVLGAPHIRQRLWWVADSQVYRRIEGSENNGRGAKRVATERPSGRAAECSDDCAVSGVADSNGGNSSAERKQSSREHRQQQEDDSVSRVDDSSDTRCSGQGQCEEIGTSRDETWMLKPTGPSTSSRVGDSKNGDRWGRDCTTETGIGAEGVGRQRPTISGAIGREFWSEFDVIPCQDGKSRRIEPGAQQMDDGFSESLGRLRPGVVAKIEEEIAGATLTNTDAREAVRTLWAEYATQAIQRTPGRCRSLHEAPVLLAFMRELAREGWQFADHLPSACFQDVQEGLRELRDSASQVARSSLGRESEQQQSVKSPDAMSVVSQAIARAIEDAWMIPYPLAHGVSARVGRLRGYGNAIDPVLAAEFITAYMECL